MRLFVALELPAAAVEALEAFAGEAAEPAVWRRVPAASLHVTLAFLGQREPERVPAIAAVLEREAGGPAPPLELGGALLLPPRRPRVLCAALADPSGTLAALQGRIADGLVAAGALEPEARPFRPHVTVARLRAGATAPRGVDAAPAPLAFPGGPVTLFESRLGGSPARYEPLARAALSAR